MTSAARPQPARSRRFDLIVFDWDGTLYDSTAVIVRSLQGACRDIGAPVPTDVDAAYVIGLSLRAALEHVAPGLAPEHYPQLVERYRRHYAAVQHQLTLFPGVVDLLAALRERNHWLAVATGKSRSGLDEALAAVELRGLFHGSRTADETRSKPDPTMLLELMSEFGTAPERTLMIGDTTHDLQLAANAGTASLAVSYGAHGREAFDAHQPLFTAHSVPELADWLLHHG